MKFKLKKAERHFVAYGYEFKPNTDVEVTDENLAKKFQKYHQLEIVGAKEVKQEEKTEEVEIDERLLLQSECEEKGIKYDKRWGVNKIKEALNGDESRNSD